MLEKDEDGISDEVLLTLSRHVLFSFKCSTCFTIVTSKCNT